VVFVHAVPISLHPDNPHYFLYHEKPTILVGSTEHYGAVLNLDFDYKTYLNSVAKAGLDLTRTWSGTYREMNNTFGILNNTMGPASGRFISPWARSSQCCYKDGGNKFDLTKFDDNYFARLKDFLSIAQSLDIIVNYGIFCRMYNQELWELSPMNGINNINNVGVNINFDSVFSLNDTSLISVMQDVTSKIVTEMNGFDNFYFEVINEPDMPQVTADWTNLIISTIVKTESSLPQKHIIAQNSLNINPATSLYSFHYGRPNDAIDHLNLNKAIGDGETGFAGPYDYAYRTQGWQWFISGGAEYDNLDYSWTDAHPDGTACCPVVGPSGGGPSLRFQLSIMKKFIESYDFIHMAPGTSFITSHTPSSAWVGALVHKDQNQYLIYVNETSTISLTLQLNTGSYRAEWLDTLSGNILRTDTINGGNPQLTSPSFVAAGDIAVGIRKM